MRIVIDHDRCSGHGRCYALAPSLFVDDEAGYGQTIDDGRVTPVALDEAERAVNACPERALSMVDDARVDERKPA